MSGYLRYGFWLGFFICTAAQACGDKGFALQVLGSGGPLADDARASSGYLIWEQGRARVLVDVGGGIFVRFGEAGASLEDLDLIAVTHLHTDHVADLAPLLKGGFLTERTRPLSIVGPGGAGAFPSIRDFIQRLFGEQGAYAYLGGLLSGEGGFFQLKIVTLDSGIGRQGRSTQDGITLESIGIPHGPVPALAYALEVAGKRVVISGDQNLSGGGFGPFLKDADIWVMPMAIPWDAGEKARALHATPAKIGQIATAAGVKRLVLSHFMARSLSDWATNITRLSGAYHGRIEKAEDLMCIPLD